MYYFSPLFIKEDEKLEYKNKGSVVALEHSIENAKRKRRYQESIERQND